MMKFICQHCDKIAISEKYRVISEEDGIIFLNMIVCDSCHEQARRLGLHAEKVRHDHLAHSRTRLNHSSAVTIAR